MPGFFDLREEIIGGGQGAPGQRFEDDHCPLLLEAMLGKWDPERRIHSGARYRLKATAEGSLIKVNLWASDNDPQWFWSFTGLEAGFEKIEDALRTKHGDWRRPKPLRRS